MQTIETVYTEKEWCKHVEKHAKKILMRYIKRKIVSAMETLRRFTIAGIGIAALIGTYWMIGAIANLIVM